MSTPGERAMNIGLVIMLLSVSAGMHSGGFGLLLCFMGVLVGSSLVVDGIRMANGFTPAIQVFSRGARPLAVFVRRNAAAVGFVMAFYAITTVSGEEDPILCFGMFALVLLRLSLINDENYSAIPPAMRTPGNRAMNIGIAIMLLSVSAGLHFGGFILLLCFVGILVGSSHIAVGVHMADGPAPIVLVVSRGVQALATFVRRDIATVGLVMVSCACAVISGEEDPVLCFGMFTLLVLGVFLINIGARDE